MCVALNATLRDATMALFLSSGENERIADADKSRVVSMYSYSSCCNYSCYLERNGKRLIKIHCINATKSKCTQIGYVIQRGDYLTHRLYNRVHRILQGTNFFPFHQGHSLPKKINTRVRASCLYKYAKLWKTNAFVTRMQYYTVCFILKQILMIPFYKSMLIRLSIILIRHNART